MVTSITVTGTGKFAGNTTNIVQYEVTEDSTPIDPSDTSGGYGQVSFTAVEDIAANGTILLLSDQVELVDTYRGRTIGVVDAVDTSQGDENHAGISRVTADSRLSILRAPVTAAPYTGTLGGAITYYLGLAGVTTGIVIDSSITNRSVTYPGWTGELFVALKRMLAAQEIEMSLVSNNITFRPIRTRLVRKFRDSEENWSASNSNLAQFVEVYNYNNVWRSNNVFYPLNGVYQSLNPLGPVGAGEQLVVSIPITPSGVGKGVSLASVNQPVPQDSIALDYTGNQSVYTIMDKNGVPMPAALWTQNGGSVTAAIGPDGTTVTVSVTGALDLTNQYAPYTLGIKDGTETYSTLRLTGTGVFYDKQLNTIPTGVPASLTAVLVGTTVDNPMISTQVEAYTAGYKTARKYSGINQVVNITATSVNNPQEIGQLVYPTISFVDSQRSGQTVGQVDTAWNGQTVKQEQDYWYGFVADTFENQTYGNVAGARALFRTAWYRIRSARIRDDLVTYSAEYDTTVDDVQSARSGMTIAQVEARYAGLKINDEALIPLWV